MDKGVFFLFFLGKKFDIKEWKLEKTKWNEFVNSKR